jgi:YgiT-type zinc finger domain-containing protein
MKTFADCSFCGGQVDEARVTYDYRRCGHLLVFDNVTAGACVQCGEKYFSPEVLKRMDEAYHDVFERQKPPERMLQVPIVTL